MNVLVGGNHTIVGVLVIVGGIGVSVGNRVAWGTGTQALNKMSGIRNADRFKLGNTKGSLEITLVLNIRSKPPNIFSHFFVHTSHLMISVNHIKG